MITSPMNVRACVCLGGSYANSLCVCHLLFKGHRLWTIFSARFSVLHGLPCRGLPVAALHCFAHFFRFFGLLERVNFLI